MQSTQPTPHLVTSLKCMASYSNFEQASGSLLRFLLSKLSKIMKVHLRLFSQFHSFIEKFNNSFASYEFTTSKSNLYPTLAETNLEIEIWSQDRHRKDTLVGIAKVDIDKILTCPIRKTPQSYIRAYDAYIPVDEVDENRNPKERVGLLRVITYLEDLGPTTLIASHEQKVTEKYKDDIKTDIPVIPTSLVLKQTKELNEDVIYNFAIDFQTSFLIAGESSQ